MDKNALKRIYNRREISRGEIGLDENMMNRNLKQLKFPVAKFKAAKNSRCEIFCSEVCGCKINRGENPIFHVQILQKHNFIFFKDKLLISSDLTVFYRKNWKNL